MKQIYLDHDPILSPTDHRYLSVVINGITVDSDIAKQFGTTRQVVKNRFTSIREKLESETNQRISTKLGILSTLSKRGTLRIE